MVQEVQHTCILTHLHVHINKQSEMSRAVSFNFWRTDLINFGNKMTHFFTFRVGIQQQITELCNIIMIRLDIIFSC